MELFAYLDPGSASALLAAVLAGIAGAGAAIRTYGAKIKEKLFFWKKNEPAIDGPAATASSKADGPSATASHKADPVDDKTAEN